MTGLCVGRVKNFWSVPDGRKIFLSPKHQIGSGAHPVPCLVDAGKSFFGGETEESNAEDSSQLHDKLKNMRSCTATLPCTLRRLQGQLCLLICGNQY
jgi:hypothetical protein